MRLENYRDSLLAQRFCAARTFLRRLLATHLNVRPDEVTIHITRQGKPQLVSTDGPLWFNLSHTGDHLLLALSSGYQVGVDVETIRGVGNRQRIAERLFSPADQRELRLSGYDPATFTQLWTGLEARQKCLGQGIFGPRAESGIQHRVVHVTDEHVASVAWVAHGDQPEFLYLRMADAEGAFTS